jgi:hypothetical protein
MSEETTENISGTRSFEERILARLDSIDSRLQVLEEQSERRAIETSLSGSVHWLKYLS